MVNQPAIMPRRRWRAWLSGLLCLAVTSGTMLVEGCTRQEADAPGVDSEPAQGATPASSERKTGGAPAELIGRWYRPDGGYVLEVRADTQSGGLTASYFNPRPINVSNTKSVLQGGKIRLFVELKDAGYPGSTYDLVYDRGTDQLRGIYYQAALDQSFEVFFVRD